ncbi:hypothetical protein [Streptomyces sp. NRRL B-1140]|uniref:hypothetical protein n=1 Tax=Streptomyces sp. NRRL B-1140 TaxID=1415549 RepID=UPI00131B1C2B|nr:hypothetical protein [Streptomyces sp. NRRL B-1140]
MGSIQLISSEDVKIHPEEFAGYVERPHGVEISDMLEIRGNEILALDIEMDDSGEAVDLWQLYRDHRGEYDASVTRSVKEVIGDDADVIIFIRAGSFHISGGFSSSWGRWFSVRRIIDGIVGAVKKTTSRLVDLTGEFRPTVKAFVEVVEMANSLANVARQLWNFWIGGPSGGGGESSYSSSCASVVIEWVRKLFRGRGYDYGFGAM